MNTFMTFVVGFFVWTVVPIGLGWVFLKMIFPGNWTREPPRPRHRTGFYCVGASFSGSPYSPSDLAVYPHAEPQHRHVAIWEARACGDRWLAAEEARCKHPHLVTVESGGEAVALLCPDCDQQVTLKLNMPPGAYKAREMTDGSVQYISMATGEVHEVRPAS